jgi:uncharacterized lipoprotein YddW (UPF0748 family)
VRAVWVDAVRICSDDPVQGKADILQFVRRMADANFNLMLVFVTSDYVRALDPAVPASVDRRAKWDAAGQLIAAAHEHGMRVHLWYSFIGGRSRRSPEFNPAFGGDPAWVAVNADQRVPDRKTGAVQPPRMADVCPDHPEARQWEIQTIERALDRYPLVEGVHLEEPGYTIDNYCVCDLCQQRFKALYGTDLIDHIGDPTATDFRCANVTAFVNELRTRLKKRPRRLVFSCNGGYRWQRERLLGRDWRRWARDRWLDYYVAQIYTPNLPDFEQRVGQVIDDVGPQTPVIAGIAVQWSTGTNTVENAVGEVDVARRMGAKGVIFYIGHHLTDDYLRALKAGPFAEPARLPAFAR